MTSATNPVLKNRELAEKALGCRALVAATNATRRKPVPKVPAKHESGVLTQPAMYERETD